MPMAERFFNTTGPVVAADHYCLPPLGRLDLDELLRLIDSKRYFVLHAPRQTGKTSTLLALRDLLNGRGGHRCVYANLETAQTARGDVEAGMRAILGGLADRALVTLGDGFLDGRLEELLAAEGPHGALRRALSRWSLNDPKPLVLLLDEIDALVGDTLISVLRQLRAGYDMRPAAFPQSVILCGIRDVRDYRIHSESAGEVIAGGSAFNIKAKSLRLGNLDEADVYALLGQHTAETGQAFTEDALAAVWEQSQGQPGLVNALAYQACFDKKANRDRSRTIDLEAVMEAREALILGRQTHLHQLADKLREERVRRVVEPVLSGSAAGQASPEDVEYVRDLGLLPRRGSARIANPIYREVIPRELMYAREAEIVQETEWYVKADGDLDVEGLLAAFQRFFREHSEHWIEGFQYKEAGPQLLLQAFLQRVVNGGVRIEREYALGSRRTELLIVWPPGRFAGKSEPGTPARRYVVECRILHGSMDATITEGLEQTLAYMDRCQGESGHLVIFDRDPSKPWEEKLYRRKESLNGRPVTLWGA
ncbi:MAG: ATP-binding protein [Gammaproteobacteria bacterium]|nr:ATP-binding protein [Gammaproteobacteria bacterium]